MRDAAGQLTDGFHLLRLTEGAFARLAPMHLGDEFAGAQSDLGLKLAIGAAQQIAAPAQLRRSRGKFASDGPRLGERRRRDAHRPAFAQFAGGIGKTSHAAAHVSRQQPGQPKAENGQSNRGKRGKPENSPRRGLDGGFEQGDAHRPAVFRPRVACQGPISLDRPIFGPAFLASGDGVAPALARGGAEPRLVIRNPGDELIVLIENSDHRARPEFGFDQIEKAGRVQADRQRVKRCAAAKHRHLDETGPALRNRAENKVPDLGRAAGKPLPDDVDRDMLGQRRTGWRQRVEHHLALRVAHGQPGARHEFKRFPCFLPKPVQVTCLQTRRPRQRDADRHMRVDLFLDQTRQRFRTDEKILADAVALIGNQPVEHQQRRQQQRQRRHQHKQRKLMPQGLTTESRNAHLRKRRYAAQPQAWPQTMKECE
jgi:hypothetical protein